MSVYHFYVQRAWRPEDGRRPLELELQTVVSVLESSPAPWEGQLLSWLSRPLSLL